MTQVGKIASGLITMATGQIDKIAQERLNQIIRSGGTEIKRVLPKVLHGAIEDVYQTPFRNFGKQQFQKVKRKLLR